MENLIEVSSFMTGFSTAFGAVFGIGVGGAFLLIAYMVFAYALGAVVFVATTAWKIISKIKENNNETSC